MKNTVKRIGCLLILICMMIAMMPIMADEGYTVTFNTDEHAAVDVYYTQDYTLADEVNVSAALARNSDTGDIDVSGDGQVNFRVIVEDGYEIESVAASGSYKNLKSDVGGSVDNVYRLTKIAGEATVTITVKAKETASEPVVPDEPSTGDAHNIVVNEIESNGDITDWVEIYNKGDEAVDISGWYILDDDAKHISKVTPLAEGTILKPGEFYVFEGDRDFTFGLGAPDEVNLYDKDGNLIEKHSWSTHATSTLGRYPDGLGAMSDTLSTKGAANKIEETTKPEYNAIDWPGSDKVITVDEGVTMFKSDSSGLDFHNGQLYCINNKNGTFWVMDVNKDGSMDYAEGFTSSGKNLAFRYDMDNPLASNPDAEGITVDGNGMAYAAVERDNNDNKVNANWIVQFDPWADGPVVIASNEWDITGLLPDVEANAGIEAVEWVADEDLEGKLYDENMNAPYDPDSYQGSIDGVFFVALEKNGHVYAFVLYEDSSAVCIADIDPGIGGAMALDYDEYEDRLWVGADDGYGNISARIAFNGSDKPDITLVNPPKGMDITRNNEGFAIADAEYSVNGLRPVYHFMDGINTGVLTVSYLNCDYKAVEDKPSVSDNVDNTVTAASARPVHIIPDTSLKGDANVLVYSGPVVMSLVLGYMLISEDRKRK